MREDIRGLNKIDYKTYDNKKLATFWLTYSNIWNLVVIILMISATISIHTALKEHAMAYNWAIYTMYSIIGIYAVFYITVLALSSNEKDEKKALKKILIFRRLAVTMRAILEIFYVVLLIMLGEDVGAKNDMTAGWSYFAAALMILRNALAILRQIFFYFIRLKRDKKREERKEIRKVRYQNLKKDVQREQLLLEQKQKEVDAHSNSIQYRLWSLYNESFVRNHEVGVEKELIVDGAKIEEEDIAEEVQVIYEAPQEIVEDTDVENIEDLVEDDTNLLNNNNDIEKYIYDAPDVAADDISDDSDIFMSFVEIISDFSTVFDFPDGKTRSDD